VKFVAYKFRPMRANLAAIAMVDLPTSEPTIIHADDTVPWTRELPEYSAADGWALKYRLLYSTGMAVVLPARVATLHTVTPTAAATAGAKRYLLFHENQIQRLLMR
jgi:hypothetical protein